MKNSRATLFFRASASCSKILNNEKYTFNTVNSGHPLFFRASASYSKILNVKSIFNTVKNSRATLFSGQAQVTQNSKIIKNIFNTAKIFRASASCSKTLNNKKQIQYIESGHPLFFRTSASCSKILNVNVYSIKQKIFGQPYFSGLALVAKKCWMMKTACSKQWKISWHPLFFRANACKMPYNSWM